MCIFVFHLPDSVAQLVEQMTLNHWVESSNLSGVTKGKDVFDKHLSLFYFLFKSHYQHVVIAFALAYLRFTILKEVILVANNSATMSFTQLMPERLFKMFTKVNHVSPRSQNFDTDVNSAIQIVKSIHAPIKGSVNPWVPFSALPA